jgi:hypothetical protein
MSSLFKNYVSPGRTKKKDAVKQQKPAVGTFPWMPNRQIGILRQPHEKGTFFSVKATGDAAVIDTPQKQPNPVKLFPTNPVTIGLTPVQILLDNPNRVELSVSNIGITHIYLGFGRVPSITSYDYVLAVSGVADDGTGAVWIGDNFSGSVYAISDGAAGKIAIKELP